MNKKKSQYYGKEDSDLLTYLEFGSIDISSQHKRIWKYLLHQDAYDFYMLPRYMRDIFKYRDLIKSTNPKINDFNDMVNKTAHKDIESMVLKYSAILTAFKHKSMNNEGLRLCEVGSTIFEIIDQMKAVNKIMSESSEDIFKYINNGSFFGIEISDLMNRTAKEIHSGININLNTSINEFLLNKKKFDVLYAEGLSLQYALSSSSELIELCKIPELSIFRRIRFSTNETKLVKLGTGKYGHNISFMEFFKECKLLNKKIYFLKDNTKIYPPGVQSASHKTIDHEILMGDFIVCSEDLQNYFIKNYVNTNKIINLANKKKIVGWTLVGTESEFLKIISDLKKKN